MRTMTMMIMMMMMLRSSHEEPAAARSNKHQAEAPRSCLQQPAAVDRHTAQRNREISHSPPAIQGPSHAQHSNAMCMWTCQNIATAQRNREIRPSPQGIRGPCHAQHYYTSCTLTSKIKTFLCSWGVAIWQFCTCEFVSRLHEIRGTAVMTPLLRKRSFRIGRLIFLTVAI